jgi:hypothetical protein
MARTIHVYTIDHVATLIGENLELLREVASNSDNIDYGEMIHVQDGTEEGITTFTDRGIESLQEFLADVRTWNGSIRSVPDRPTMRARRDRAHHGRRAKILTLHGLRRMLTVILATWPML